MIDDLLHLAEKERITIDYWDFVPPLEAVFLSLPNGKAFIGLDKSLKKNIPYMRCVLAEEIGHYYTTVGDHLPVTLFHYAHRITLSQAEHKALRWAAEYLMPADEIRMAYAEGLREPWEFAERFDVTEQMVLSRFMQLEVCAANPL